MEQDVHYEEPPLQTATRIVNLCGTVSNTVITLIVALAMLMSSRNRSLPRMWLLLGLVVAYLAVSSFSLYASWDYTYWVSFDWTDISCTLMLTVDDCLDFVTVLCSVLLACHVFMWTFIPSSENGRKTLIFWNMAVIVSWFISFVGMLALKAPYTEVVTLGFRSITYCKTMLDIRTEIIESCLKFLLPFVFALPISFISACYTVLMKFKSKDENAVELESLPGTSQTNPEYFGIAPIQQEETSATMHSNRTLSSQPTPAHLQWVVFNMVLIFFGFSLRLPERLTEQHVFRDAIFDKTAPHDFTIFMIFSLLRAIYYSFILMMSFVLPEVRGVVPNVIGHCRRIYGRL